MGRDRRDRRKTPGPPPAATAIEPAVASVHGSGRQVHLVVTGGGARAISDLTRVPGASATVLEALVPYSSASMTEFLGLAPRKACSPETARLLAIASYRAACRLAPRGGLPVGIAATSALRTNRPKRGAHRCHLASWDGSTLRQASLGLEKNARSRAEEEEVARHLILELLARTCGPSRIDLTRALLRPEERIARSAKALADPIQALLSGSRRFVRATEEGALDFRRPGSAILFPGSFNPLHRGHLALSATASLMAGRPVVFEVSVLNVDKARLDRNAVYRRLHGLQRSLGRPLPAMFTRAPTFLEKARLFPGRTFLVGFDTAQRLVDPAYHGKSEARRDRALAEMRRLRTRFLVAGRLARGKFRTLAEIPVPSRYLPLFEAIPEERFRVDLSSTEIRKARGLRGLGR